MKIYKHTGNGHYIGSCIIVVADSLENAISLIQTILIEVGLPNEKIQIEEFEIQPNTVILDANGDY